MKMPIGFKVCFAALGLYILAYTVVAAQKLYVGPTADTPRWAKKGDFDGSVLFCRGHYTMVRSEPEGIGWWTDYPGADHNFMVRLAELTEVRVRFDPERIPFYVTLKLDDPLLFKCPILFMSDVGTLGFNEAEIKNLQRYFAKGGFLWTDDFWGHLAWEQWEYEIRRVLPSGKYRMIDVPADHPILHQLYDVPAIWQQSNAWFWSANDHEVSERGPDSAEPHLRAILDERDRVIVVMTHNTDIADGWEEEKEENLEYLSQFSAKSYAFGVNVFLYALTH